MKNKDRSTPNINCGMEGWGRGAHIESNREERAMLRTAHYAACEGLADPTMRPGADCSYRDWWISLPLSYFLSFSSTLVFLSHLNTIFLSLSPTHILSLLHLHPLVSLTLSLSHTYSSLSLLQFLSFILIHTAVFLSHNSLSLSLSPPTHLSLSLTLVSLSLSFLFLSLTSFSLSLLSLFLSFFVSFLCLSPTLFLLCLSSSVSHSCPSFLLPLSLAVEVNCIIISIIIRNNDSISLCILK